MEVIDGEGFAERIAHGWMLRMDVSIYAGVNYECGCGECHKFDFLSSIVLRELPGMKLVIACPDKLALTCVKIKGLTTYAFESCFATPDVGVAEILLQEEPELQLRERDGLPSPMYYRFATRHSKVAMILWCIGGVVYIVITGRLSGLPTLISFFLESSLPRCYPWSPSSLVFFY